MTAQTLDSPIVTGAALRSVNFFNGRLLTGDDLRREQTTLRSHLARLGRAVGEGVAYGLEVQETIGTSSKGKPVVTVAAGLALTRSGLALELAAPVDVALARSRPVAGSEPGGLFADCQPFAPGTYTAGAGVYLLTIGPAQRGEGRAPVSGLSNEPAPCNVAASVEAVRFRLIRLALTPAELTDKDHLRNRIAYACFGAGALAGFVSNPFGAALARYGLIDTLREQTLGDDEVPLGVLGWAISDGIQFVDEWSVRRRVVRRGATTDWSLLAGDRRPGEGEARLLQFQDQLDDIALREPAPSLFEARSRFRLLPAAGLLRVGPGSFGTSNFFAGMKVRGPAFIEGAKLEAVLRQSYAYPPIAITNPEAVWLYVVRENVQASGAVGTSQCVVFANGHTPYAADARADLSYWNYANFALRAM
jgi:hypothetical protein